MALMLGHDEAWRAWRAGTASGRLHHGWLLVGRKGLGKATFAFAAARELLTGGAAAPELHPDILVLAPLPDKEDDEKKKAEGKSYKTKRNISVDQVRAMQRRLTTRPTLGTHRAIIIDSADELERGAANALLKSLEEPPQGSVFLLVSHRPGQLPPTIRSRCQVLRFPALADDAIAAVLAREAPELGGEDRTAAIAAASGAPGAALDFVGRGLGKVQRTMARIVGEGDPRLTLRGTLSAEIGPRPDREQLGVVLELARRVLAEAAGTAGRERQARIVEAHAALSALIAEAPTANFDPGLLMLQIGGLLASAAPPRETAG